jgi:hypothetical protein
VNSVRVSIATKYFDMLEQLAAAISADAIDARQHWAARATVSIVPADLITLVFRVDTGLVKSRAIAIALQTMLTEEFAEHGAREPEDRSKVT